MKITFSNEYTLSCLFSQDEEEEEEETEHVISQKSMVYDLPHSDIFRTFR